jgi:hypothetical protein
MIAAMSSDAFAKAVVDSERAEAVEVEHHNLLGARPAAVVNAERTAAALRAADAAAALHPPAPRRAAEAEEPAGATVDFSRHGPLSTRDEENKDSH